ncbi:MAG TPA: hypothetical protein VN222_00065, partial [Novosphingobium sp.]|nr:hypothetical protein [Novosphingobium sp.]
MAQPAQSAPQRLSWLDRAFGALSPVLLDRVERGLILLLWVWLVARVLGSGAVGSNGWLVLVSETAVMAFTL